MVVHKDFIDNWITQVRKGLLTLMVLNALSKKRRYGYELSKYLSAFPGMHVNEATIYPLLSRLKLQKILKTTLIESSEGPARKYYTLTAKGEKNLKLMNQEFIMLTQLMDTIGTGAIK